MFAVMAVAVVPAGTAVAQGQRFPDVPADHWAFEAVEWAASAGVTLGYGDGTFRPPVALGRWHALTFMERYYDEILQADESPDFTRADMMVLLKAINDGTLRTPDAGGDSTADVSGSGGGQRFPDVPADHYAFEAVEWAASAGVTLGYGDGTFRPSVALGRWHALVFMERYYDEILQADESADFTRADMMVLLKAINDGTLRTPDPLGESEKLENHNPNNIPNYDPDVFYTERNKLSVFVKEGIVDVYADEHPWLLEVWNYTNRPDFEYRMVPGAHVKPFYIYNAWGDDMSLRKIGISRLNASERCIDEEYCWDTFIHEMAHIYTLANDAPASRTGPLAIAHLYFADLSRRLGNPTLCPGHELYADTAALLVPLMVNIEAPASAYWNWCENLPIAPTEEALAIVESAFAGAMPQWLYDTFQLPDGSLDYGAIWSEVNAMEEHLPAVKAAKVAIVHQLRNEFGGYCEGIATWQLPMRLPDLVQPWRDGGCPN